MPQEIVFPQPMDTVLQFLLPQAVALDTGVHTQELVELHATVPGGWGAQGWAAVQVPHLPVPLHQPPGQAVSRDT